MMRNVKKMSSTFAGQHPTRLFVFLGLIGLLFFICGPQRAWLAAHDYWGEGKFQQPAEIVEPAGEAACTDGALCKVVVRLTSEKEKLGPLHYMYARALGPATASSATATWIDSEASQSLFEVTFMPPEAGKFRVEIYMGYRNITVALQDHDQAVLQENAHIDNYHCKPVDQSPLLVKVGKHRESPIAASENTASTANAKDRSQVTGPPQTPLCTHGDVAGYWKAFDRKDKKWKSGAHCPLSTDGINSPVWLAYDCHWSPFTRANTEACLNRYEFVLIGDSVTRHMHSSLFKKFGVVKTSTPLSPSFQRLRKLTMKNEQKGWDWSNPHKIEAAKLYKPNVLENLVDTLGKVQMDPNRSVAIVNFGLHDAAFGSLVTYQAQLREALWAVLRSGFGHVIWRKTTALYPWATNIMPRSTYRTFTMPRVEMFNQLADEVITEINAQLANERPSNVSATHIKVVDGYGMTAARPDGTIPRDMRHYCATVMSEMWSVVLTLLCPTGE